MDFISFYTILRLNWFHIADKLNFFIEKYKNESENEKEISANEEEQIVNSDTLSILSTENLNSNSNLNSLTQNLIPNDNWQIDISNLLSDDKDGSANDFQIPQYCGFWS
ncbi:hypothetical protein RhiirA4_472322 [Rhizophagus irregularis]|uniref:Uncharacterized protein n=1 Tax=Rhizophagus irregularis TaxID=588596 RepID=A0A2I1H4R8_9GLOM|nr:hypothetical protein RhiirA4_472322 [Rhizophagus irregularis]